MTQKIKELPVGTIYGQEELDAIQRVLESGESLTRGPEVDAFEKEFAKYVGAKYAISTSSCGAALKIANQVTNLGKQDEVICQDNAFWVSIVSFLERKVSLHVADINPNTLNINPEKIPSLITPKTKAIFLMHHGGNPADLQPIHEIANDHDLVIIEDAAHAIGAEYQGKKIGCNSDLACFSFSTLKNMGTLGEGGMLVTNNEEYAEMARGLRTNYPFGTRKKRQVKQLGSVKQPQSVAFMHMGDAWDYDWVETKEFGTTARLSAVQAAVGRIQLKKLDRHISLRTNIAGQYNKEISQHEELRQLQILPHCKPAWHLFSYFLNKDSGLSRDQYIHTMEQQYNIETVIRFFPTHLGGIMRMHGHKQGECPIAEQVWFHEQLSLPISPQIPQKDIDYITKSIHETLQTLRGEQHRS